MSSGFYSSIICQLLEEALPPPEFVLSVTLNRAEFTNLSSSNFYHENDSLTLRLVGPINLDNTSTLDVRCDVSNEFGNDTTTTSISLCGKFFIKPQQWVLLYECYRMHRKVNQNNIIIIIGICVQWYLVKIPLLSC